MIRTRELDHPTLSESGGVRYLHFGTDWIQGAMRVRRPAELVLAYTQQMMAWLMFLEPGKEDRLAILGLGAGSLLRYSLKHTPCQIDTVEWNPAVTGICQAYFRLPDTARSQIIHEDAGLWVADPQQRGQYLALMVDLYDGEAQGPVRDSLEFYQACYRSLADEGIMTVNLFGAHHSFEHNIDHIRQAFKGRVLLLPEMDEGNQIAIAFKGPVLNLTTQELIDRAERVQQEYEGLPAVRWAREILSQRSVEQLEI